MLRPRKSEAQWPEKHLPRGGRAKREHLPEPPTRYSYIIIFIFKCFVFIAYLIFGHVDSAELTSFKGCRKFRNLHYRRESTTHRFQGGTFLMPATAEECSELAMREIKLGGATARTCAEALADKELASIGLLWHRVGPHAEAITHRTVELLEVLRCATLEHLVRVVAVNDATWRPHARLVSRVLQRLWVQLRQEEDVAASPRKTTETTLDRGRDLILDLARQTVANALRMRCHLKNMHLQDFRRPNPALSYSPIGLSTFKLQE